VYQQHPPPPPQQQHFTNGQYYGGYHPAYVSVCVHACAAAVCVHEGVRVPPCVPDQRTRASMPAASTCAACVCVHAMPTRMHAHVCVCAGQHGATTGGAHARALWAAAPASAAAAHAPVPADADNKKPGQPQVCVCVRVCARAHATCVRKRRVCARECVHSRARRCDRPHTRVGPCTR
jgi:hypothetical protein